MKIITEFDIHSQPNTHCCYGEAIDQARKFAWYFNTRLANFSINSKIYRFFSLKQVTKYEVKPDDTK